MSQPQNKWEDRDDTYNHTVLANVNIWSYLSSVHNTVLLYEHMVPNMQGEESHANVHKHKQVKSYTFQFISEDTDALH